MLEDASDEDRPDDDGDADDLDGVEHPGVLLGPAEVGVESQDHEHQLGEQEPDLKDEEGTKDTGLGVVEVLLLLVGVLLRRLVVRVDFDGRGFRDRGCEPSEMALNVFVLAGSGKVF